jgi:hypothetical protein
MAAPITALNTTSKVLRGAIFFSRWPDSGHVDLERPNVSRPVIKRVNLG